MSHSVAEAASISAERRTDLFTGWRTMVGLPLLLVWAAWTSKVDLRLIFSVHALRSIADLLTRLFPPDISGEFLKVAIRASLTTVATGIVVTVLSAAIALPMGILASGRLWRVGIMADRPGQHGNWMARLSWLGLHGMGVIRSIPDLVWALLFVAGLGLGPLAGTLALVLSYAALLGRVYADIFDEVDSRPLEALQGTGATRMQVLLFGILPKSRALLTSYTLYSLECSIRSAAVLGFVGAGGLGYEIYLSMRLFEFHQVLTLLICFILLLLFVDMLSRGLRTRLAVATSTPTTSLKRSWLVGAGLSAAFLVSLPASGMTATNLLQNDTVSNFFHFAHLFLVPEVAPAFLVDVGRLAFETISISLVGTAVGTIVGFFLALPATRLRDARHESLGRSWVSRLQSESLFWSARMILNLLRAIPELVWVLVCVIAVGFGPFAGAIALGLHTGGVLGRLFAETMEECKQGPVEAALAMGASSLQCLFWVLLPQSWAMMRRYVLLRWDMNLRAATILGLVGGGGLGQALYNNVQLGAYGKVSTLILAVIVLVIGTDWLTRSNEQSALLTE